jgi:fructose-bisphosphate aldolase class 1
MAIRSQWCQSPAEIFGEPPITDMNTQLLIDTAKSLFFDHKGLLAMDESNPTCNKRFANLDIPQTVEARRAYREPNMVLPGLTCPPHQEVKEVGVGEQQYQVRLTDRKPDEEQDIEEVANITVKGLWRTVPAAVPGIAFLSSGQSAELATARLNLMNLRFKTQLPRALSFSFARAIQQPALEIWRGQEATVKAAQQALLHRARCNRAARRVEYSAAMEKTDL